MHVAQSPRPRSQPAPGRASAPRAQPPAGPAAPLQRAADAGARDDRLSGVLAGAVQRRAVARPLLQRAIIAIDGPTDGKVAREVTRNCLHNLTHTRARGAAAGPDAVGDIAPPPLANKESLYILGHGNPQIVADLTPDQLGAAIIGWYGGTHYRGTVKLVACSSAIVPKGIGAASYADKLNTYLTNNATTTFRPKSVDGVLGVAWVHEKHGNILAIDDDEYTVQEQLGENVEGAFAEPDPKTRRRELKRIFGAPDATGSSVKTGKPGAKVRYYTNLPKHPPGVGAGFLRFLRKLVPCIP